MTSSNECNAVCYALCKEVYSKNFAEVRRQAALSSYRTVTVIVFAEVILVVLLVKERKEKGEDLRKGVAPEATLLEKRNESRWTA